MNLLAVDAAGEDLTAALEAGGRVFAVRRPARVPHDESLLPAVEGLLTRARLDWEDLDAVAAAAGPGRFTGIRIGLAFAAMAGLRLGVPALALSRLEGAAEKAGGPALAALTGWKGEVYHQSFRRGRRGPAAAGAAAWCSAEDWPKTAAAARSRGLTVVHEDAAAADLLPVLRRRLAAKDFPPFKPFYLKPAGYEKPRG